MNIFKRIINNNKLQAGNRNRALIKKMRSLNFTPRQIRLALVGANQINLSKIQTSEINLPMLSRTVHGFSKNKYAQQHFAKHLGLTTDDLF